MRKIWLRGADGWSSAFDAAMQVARVEDDGRTICRHKRLSAERSQALERDGLAKRGVDTG